MRGWQILRHGEPAEAIEAVEVPTPEPGPGELRIRVEAAALGLPDVFMCRGSYAFRPEIPFTPGQEVVGTVDAVGSGVNTPIGTRLMGVTAFFRGFGGLADSALALDASMYPAPPDMSASDAASFVIPYHTAFLGLVTRGQLQAGETLVVLGAAGGSGSAAIALGHALGARVIACVGGDDKASWCRRLGADAIVDHNRGDLTGALRDATGEHGADVIFDPVGGEAFDAGLGCIASEGRLLAIGYASGAWSDASTGLLVGKNASVVGVFVGAYAKPFLSEVHEALLDHWKAGRIPGLATRQVGFDAVGSALSDLAARRSFGKLVVKVN
jgi:NADPH2:quinone reductase